MAATDLRRDTLYGRAGDVAFGVVFLTLLSLPLAKTLVHGGEFEPTTEKRFPAPVPRLSWTTLPTYPAAIEAAFDDRFAFRLTLIRLANLVEMRLGVSTNKDVLIGRKGWLFYAGEREVAEFRRLEPFTKGMLRAYTDVFEKRRAWLAYRGIRYMVVVPPNKDVVYPEYMPRALDRLPGPSRLDELMRSASARTGVDIVDLRPALAAARRAEPVYLVTDTHWNSIGAFVGYRVIATELGRWFPGLTPLSRDDLHEAWSPTSGGDLSGLLAVSNDMTETAHVDVRLEVERSVEVDPELAVGPDVPLPARPRAREIHDGTLPRAVVFRDSFVDGMIPYLSEHFSRVLYVSRHDFPVEVVLREHPDVVIDELIERGLMRAAPTNPPELERDDEGAFAGDPAGMDESHPPGFVLPSIDTADANELRALPGGKLEATGPDPYVLVRAALPFDAEANRLLRVKLAATVPRDDIAPRNVTVQLFWASPGENFSERASVRFPAVVDGEMHEYRVVPSLSGSFTGIVERMRLDFADERPGLVYELGSVELEPRIAKVSR